MDLPVKGSGFQNAGYGMGDRRSSFVLDHAVMYIFVEAILTSIISITAAVALFLAFGCARRCPLVCITFGNSLTNFCICSSLFLNYLLLLSCNCNAACCYGRDCRDHSHR